MPRACRNCGNFISDDGDCGCRDEMNEVVGQCENCGSDIDLEQFDRSGITGMCDSCPESMCPDCEMPEEECPCEYS